jgi:hypothetical protein
MSKKLEAYLGLPSEVKFCKKCVISNQRPSSTIEFRHTNNDKKQVIDFDEEGICSACRFQEEKQTNIDWKKREDTLLRLLDKFRRKDGGYDIVVPGSGGKDSAFTSHILKGDLITCYILPMVNFIVYLLNSHFIIYYIHSSHL